MWLPCGGGPPYAFFFSEYRLDRIIIDECQLAIIILILCHHTASPVGLINNRHHLDPGTLVCNVRLFKICCMK